jgi:DNA-binding NtrC family response regulator
MVTHSAPQSAVLQNVHILVVDNHQDTRDLYGFLLEDYGVKVTALSTVKESLAFLDLCRPTLLISEFRFGQESVHPLIARAKAPISNRGKRMPVIITSTCSAASLTEQLSIPIDAYLIKPIDVDNLVDAVWTLISQIRAFQPVQHQLQLLPLLHCIEA